MSDTASTHKNTIHESELTLQIDSIIPDDKQIINTSKSSIQVSQKGNSLNSARSTFSNVAPIDISFIEPEAGSPAAEALAANATIRSSSFRSISMKRPSVQTMVNNFTRSPSTIKQRSKSTKKKKESVKNFKGKVIDGVHELYTLTLGMMLGLRCSAIKYRNQQVVIKLEDFSHVEKRIFPPLGSTDPENPTPAHSLAHTFSFKSYSPNIFQKIREFFNVDVDAYMNSVCGDCNYLEFISNSKSGQFFFYSHDGKYMIKTQSNEENKFMNRILMDYYNFLRSNPNTLLVRIFGMHRVTMRHLKRKVHFVIMASVFDTPQPIHTIYDLKGSLIGRKATDIERQKGGVLKDLDLIQDKQKIHLGKKRELFLTQLERDTEFLSTLNIMDYSLLIGIHDRRKRVAGQRLASFTSSTGHIIIPHSNLPFRHSEYTTVSAEINGSYSSAPLASARGQGLEMYNDTLSVISGYQGNNGVNTTSMINSSGNRNIMSSHEHFHLREMNNSSSNYSTTNNNNIQSDSADMNHAHIHTQPPIISYMSQDNHSVHSTHSSTHARGGDTSNSVHSTSNNNNNNSGNSGNSGTAHTSRENRRHRRSRRKSSPHNSHIHTIHPPNSLTNTQIGQISSNSNTTNFSTNTQMSAVSNTTSGPPTTNLTASAHKYVTKSIQDSKIQPVDEMAESSTFSDSMTPLLPYESSSSINTTTNNNMSSMKKTTGLTLNTSILSHKTTKEELIAKYTTNGSVNSSSPGSPFKLNLLSGNNSNSAGNSHNNSGNILLPLPSPGRGSYSSSNGAPSPHESFIIPMTPSSETYIHNANYTTSSNSSSNNSGMNVQGSQIVNHSIVRTGTVHTYTTDATTTATATAVVGHPSTIQSLFNSQSSAISNNNSPNQHHNSNSSTIKKDSENRLSGSSTSPVPSLGINTQIINRKTVTCTTPRSIISIPSHQYVDDVSDSEVESNGMYEEDMYEFNSEDDDDDDYSDNDYHSDMGDSDTSSWKYNTMNHTTSTNAIRHSKSRTTTQSSPIYHHNNVHTISNRSSRKFSEASHSHSHISPTHTTATNHDSRPSTPDTAHKKIVNIANNNNNNITSPPTITSTINSPPVLERPSTMSQTSQLISPITPITPSSLLVLSSPINTTTTIGHSNPGNNATTTTTSNNNNNNSHHSNKPMGSSSSSSPRQSSPRSNTPDRGNSTTSNINSNSNNNQLSHLPQQSQTDEIIPKERKRLSDYFNPFSSRTLYTTSTSSYNHSTTTTTTTSYSYDTRNRSQSTSIHTRQHRGLSLGGMLSRLSLPSQRSSNSDFTISLDSLPQNNPNINNNNNTNTTIGNTINTTTRSRANTRTATNNNTTTNGIASAPSGPGTTMSAENTTGKPSPTATTTGTTGNRNLTRFSNLLSPKDTDLTITSSYDANYTTFSNNSSINKPWTRRHDGGINSQVDHHRGDDIYYVGIIDILQQYNMNKRVETVFKSIQYDSTKISSVNAKLYATRFVQFIRENSD